MGVTASGVPDGAAPPFVHLHVHSHFSLLSSTIRLEALCRRVAEDGGRAVALTDDGNLFGAVEFCQAAKAAGIKPIVGCDLFVARSRPAGTAESAPYRLVVLVESAQGYANLVRLSSLAYLDGLQGSRPCVTDDLLREHAGGLFAISIGAGGEVGALLEAGRPAEAEAAAARLRDAFGADRFFLGLEHLRRPGDADLADRLAALAARAGIGVVATNSARFLDPGGFEAERALECIGAGSTLDDPLGVETVEGQWLRSPADMAALFLDRPEALAASAALAERCNFSIEAAREPLLPDFAVPPGQTRESLVREQARSGLEARRREWADAPPGSRRDIPWSEYESRLARELDVICAMGFAGYFLIVWDLIRHAREQDIPVGPGRGSAAGSLVAWALRITDVDPLQYDLLFERFLNPERKSLPDIDMDFCQRRRGELIRYVQAKYGEDHVAQIITFGSLNARSVLRDVGRVLNMTYGEADRVARLVPEELGVTLDKALKESPQLGELRDGDPRVARLLTIAQELEGLARNAGVHAAGVIIAPRPLMELAPLFKTGRGEVTTQYAMGGAERVGLLKMDFLGLKTLTVLHDAVSSIERAGHGRIRLDALPMDDAATFDLFQRARTAGIFQFESSGMRDVLRKAAPTTYDDLTALNALYRPGPLKSGMVEDFIGRRHGKVKVTYPHPDLRPILEPTWGVMVYQEQVMQVAVRMASFTLGEADTLRKAMGKKLPEIMAAQKQKFVAGAVARGVDEAKAAEVFDLMEHFAGYGFNKSHSAAYALVAYWCAYLKAHHPSHFMAALLTSEGDRTDKVVRHIAECKEMGLEVLPPHVNESDVDFTAVSDSTIRFGLSAIKGVGRSAVASILEARGRVGRFTTLHGFCTEIDLRLNNKKVLEALVKAGALDGLGPGRSSLMFSLDAACEAAAAARADRESGQASLFGGPAPLAPTAPEELPRMPEWARRDRLRHEKEVLGFYVSGHPLEEHAAILGTLGATSSSDLVELDGREITLAGIVAACRKTRTRKGDWMAFLTLEDMTGQAEVIAFPETWKTAQAFALDDAALCVRGTVEVDGDRAKVLATEITPLRRAEEAAASALLVRLPSGMAGGRLAEALAAARDVLATRPGHCPVQFELAVPDLGTVRIQAASRFAVTPEAALVSSLEKVVGQGRVSLTFR